MTVQDVLDEIEAYDNYVTNSLINKSFDDRGCTYIWLAKNAQTSAFRQEMFIATSNSISPLEDRTVITYVTIGEAR